MRLISFLFGNVGRTMPREVGLVAYCFGGPYLGCAIVVYGELISRRGARSVFRPTFRRTVRTFRDIAAFSMDVVGSFPSSLFGELVGFGGSFGHRPAGVLAGGSPRPDFPYPPTNDVCKIEPFGRTEELGIQFRPHRDAIRILQMSSSAHMDFQ